MKLVGTLKNQLNRAVSLLGTSSNLTKGLILVLLDVTGFLVMFLAFSALTSVAMTKTNQGSNLQSLILGLAASTLLLVWLGFSRGLWIFVGKKIQAPKSFSFASSIGFLSLAIEILVALRLYYLIF